MRPSLIWFVLIAAWGCGEDDRLAVPDSGVPVADSPVTYAADIQPLWEAYCRDCHIDGFRSVGLGAAESYDELLNEGCGEGALVVPGHPEESHLLRVLGVLTHDAPDDVPAECSLLMPYGLTPLAISNPEATDLIAAWIRQGARDD